MSDKPSALETVYLAIGEVKSDGSMIPGKNHIIPNVDISYHDVRGRVEFKVHTNAFNDFTKWSPELNKRYHVNVLATQDPTPDSPGGHVSLGYFMFQWVMQYATLKSYDPLTFVGQRDSYNTKQLLDLWDYTEKSKEYKSLNIGDCDHNIGTREDKHCNMLKHKILNFDASETKIDYIMPKNLDDPMALIVTGWNENDKKGETVAIQLNTRSYWEYEKSARGRILHENSDKAFKYHDKLVKEVRREVHG